MSQSLSSSPAMAEAAVRGGNRYTAVTLRCAFPVAWLATAEPETIERCAEAGADVFVAGSAVYSADDPDAMVIQLRKLAEASSGS